MPLQSRGGPGMHAPAEHASSVVQYCPSEHGAPSGRTTWVQPLVGLQPSVVQALPSSQLSGVPIRHPPATQVSCPLHGFWSSHCEFVLHEQLCTGAPRHWLALQVSGLVHWLPSLQVAPSFEGWVHIPDAH